MKERISDCRRFCSGRSIKGQQRATTRQGEAATHSTPITCDLQNSIEFNKCRNCIESLNRRSPRAISNELLSVVKVNISYNLDIFCSVLTFHLTSKVASLILNGEVSVFR